MTTPRDDTHGNAAYKSDKNIQFIRIYLYNVLRSNIILSHTHPCCINVDVEIFAAGQVLAYLLDCTRYARQHNAYLRALAAATYRKFLDIKDEILSTAWFQS